MVLDASVTLGNAVATLDPGVVRYNQPSLDLILRNNLSSYNLLFTYEGMFLQEYNITYTCSCF